MSKQHKSRALNNKKDIQLIIEEPYIPTTIDFQIYDIEILKEEYDRTTKTPKIRFRTIVQEADTINKNGRKYPKHVLEDVVNRFNHMIQSKGVLPGELNHPLIENERIAKQRMATIDLDNIAVVYHKFELDGKYVIAEGSTASTRKGRDLYGLIVEDGYKIGFSLRALGTVKPVIESDGRKIYIVEEIYRPVTYDVVDNPSHSIARIYSLNENELINNDSNDNNNELTIINEHSRDIISIYTTANLVTYSDEKILEEISKEDPELSRFINKLLEDSIELTIDNNIVRICKDDQCIIKPIEDVIEDLINLYFPNTNDTIQLSPAYDDIARYLSINPEQLFNPRVKLLLYPYLINRLIQNQNRSIILPSVNTESIVENVLYNNSDNNINSISTTGDHHQNTNIILTENEQQSTMLPPARDLLSVIENEELLQLDEQDLKIIELYLSNEQLIEELIECTLLTDNNDESEYGYLHDIESLIEYLLELYYYYESLAEEENSNNNNNKDYRDIKELAELTLENIKSSDKYIHEQYELFDDIV